jgi:uncharacterized protein
MKKIAVVGSGISGLSAAWLLSKNHRVTLFEKDDRLGGHSNTVNVKGQNIDTGFIVYNTTNYPNLVAFFDHLSIKTQPTEMSFGVSLDRGALEYAGTSLGAMFAQKTNFFRPKYWGMIRDIMRFYREAPKLLEDNHDDKLTLRDVLVSGDYGQAFIDHHLLPMGAAIWSTPADEMLDYPALTFIRFCQNHGLLQLNDRPAWRTVTDGSCQYVREIEKILDQNIRLNSAVTGIHQENKGVLVECRDGYVEKFDDVVISTHADQALSLLKKPSQDQRTLLGSFKYQKNLAILHTDRGLMPNRDKAWASWNYLGTSSIDASADNLCVTYWMNRLQDFEAEEDYFVTLNPVTEPKEGTVIRSFPYDHPLFDSKAISAQKSLWTLQGKNNLWFCGSYFGYGFHEDGIQSGLAVAEMLGGISRPWNVDFAKSRINLPETWLEVDLPDVA